MMLSWNSLKLWAFHLAPLAPGTAFEPGKARKRTSFWSWPLLPLTLVPKQAVARPIDASPTTGCSPSSPFSSPQTP